MPNRHKCKPMKYPNGRKDTAKNGDIQEFSDKSSQDRIDLSVLYSDAELEIESVETIGKDVHICAKSSLDYGVCPYCGTISHKVHSRYFRTVIDLPILGQRTVLHLWMRKFFCKNSECGKKTFAEQPGNEIIRYRRRSRRCEVTVARVGLTGSSNTASRTLDIMGIPISSSTVLRDIHRIPLPSYPSLERIGIDDWAFRKGITYGSVIVSHSTGRIVDMLPDREEESFHKWLDGHPDIKLVSRDRASAYSSAIANTKRCITEVADCFHLIKNMSECAYSIISEKYEDYRELILGERKTEDTSNGRHASRQSKFEQVKVLQSQGMNRYAIARETGIYIDTVSLYMRNEVLPVRKGSKRIDLSTLEPFVEAEFAKGRSLLDIYRNNLRKNKKLYPYKTFSTLYSHFKYLTEFRRKGWKLQIRQKRPRESRKSPLLTMRAIGRAMEHAMHGKVLSLEETRLIKNLDRLEWFASLYKAAFSFCHILKDGVPEELDNWIQEFQNSSIYQLKRFVSGIKADINAIKNCILYPISNGIVEGFVNKIKAVKRLMYGRAGLELIKRKLILEPLLFN